MEPALVDDQHRWVPFHEARWSSTALLLGIGFLLACFFVPQGLGERLVELPTWLVILVFGIGPHAFLFLFPILARAPRNRSLIELPDSRTFGRELVRTFPALVLTFVAIAIVQRVILQIFPGEEMTPDIVTKWTRSENALLTRLTLVFSFTVAPLAEELFFRGFLQNALAARMPVLLAALVQCFFFSIVHAYSAAQSAVIFVVGLILTARYRSRKTLLAPILLHAAFNFVMTLGVLAMMADQANRPMLGVQLSETAPPARVEEIVPGSAAEAAGVRVGDILEQFDSAPVPDDDTLFRLVQRHAIGDKVKLAVRRGDSTLELEATLGSRPPGE